LQADGALQPVIQRDVFVPIDGDVIDVQVKDQDRVQPGDLLVQLRNSDLEVEFQDVVGQCQAKQERLFSVEYALLNQKSLTEVERIRLSGEARELRQELDTLEKQYQLLKKKRDLLEIRAPIAGEVMMSWDVQKSLLRRPVTTGQILMSVADPTGDWELELFVRESRAGHVRRARADRQWCEKYPGAGEEVTYILATDPGTYRHGKIKEIKGGTEVHQEKGQIVKMKVDIDNEELGNPHPGATVTADVYCGRRSVAYVWFHEAWEWVQSNIIFYLS
jgi:multidrug efflux pump subunit AcrA (membrane-fusion protein)